MSSQTPSIPADLQERGSLGPAWADWLHRLPRVAASLLEEWQLRPAGAAMNGYVSLVIPVLTSDDTRAVLKITFDGDVESEQEASALTQWAGHGAVRLLRADPRRRALVLERLGPDDLTSIDDIAACEIVAGLYSSLHQPASPVFRPLTGYVTKWLDELADASASVPISPRLIDHALRAGRDLCGDPDSVGTLIHGDLHYENVMAADRADWLAIDPKPMSGDRHYEVAPLLWNRWDLVAGDVRSTISRRFFTVVDAAGLDEDRARDWVIVRAVLNAHWTVDDAGQRPLSSADRDFITRNVAIAKAVQV